MAHLVLSLMKTGEPFKEELLTANLTAFLIPMIGISVIEMSGDTLGVLNCPLKLKYTGITMVALVVIH